MQLVVDDNRIRARLTWLDDDRERLVVDYPNEPAYRVLIREALAAPLRSETARQAEPGTKERP